MTDQSEKPISTSVSTEANPIHTECPVCKHKFTHFLERKVKEAGHDLKSGASKAISSVETEV